MAAILDENQQKEKLNSTFCYDFTLASSLKTAMLIKSIKKPVRSRGMTTHKFDATPTPNEGISLDDISADNMKQAWQEYAAKPEYKEFNKHDLIESLQPKPDPKNPS